MADDQIQQVMEKIENFYFEDNDEGGEQIFNKFAELHISLTFSKFYINFSNIKLLEQ